MLTFCFLVAQGGCEPQLASCAANMRIGNDKAFLICIISRCLPYVGYPRSLNALWCVNEAAGQKYSCTLQTDEHEGALNMKHVMFLTGAGKGNSKTVKAARSYLAALRFVAFIMKRSFAADRVHWGGPTLRSFRKCGSTNRTRRAILKSKVCRPGEGRDYHENAWTL